MTRLLAFAACIAAASQTAAPADWPQWRGPSFNGYTTETALPATWSKTNNVAWVANMPGPSAATPIVLGDRVFNTAIEAQSKAMWAICLNRADGSVRWQHKIGTGFMDPRGNTAVSPSPIAHGGQVFYFFGTGDFIAFDLDGKMIWRRNIVHDHGPFKIKWRYGASPLLYKGKLYLAVMQSHDKIVAQPGKPKPMSYLLCIDPATGKDVWKQERPSKAKREAKEAYTTPYPFEAHGKSFIILVGGDHVTAHDPATGREVWRSPTYNPDDSKWYRTVASAVSVGDMLFAFAPRGHGALAIKSLPKAPWFGSDCAWIHRPHSPDVCTPLAMHGKLFMLDGRKRFISCLDPATGSAHWVGKLPAKRPLQASPTGADGKIYCISLDGTALVLSAGDEFKVLSRIEMGEGPCRSTIAAAHGQLFIRTAKHLYCIGKPHK